MFGEFDSGITLIVDQHIFDIGKECEIQTEGNRTGVSYVAKIAKNGELIFIAKCI
jgi:hypothetical protein